MIFSVNASCLDSCHSNQTNYLFEVILVPAHTRFESTHRDCFVFWSLSIESNKVRFSIFRSSRLQFMGELYTEACCSDHVLLYAFVCMIIRNVMGVCVCLHIRYRIHLHRDMTTFVHLMYVRLNVFSVRW